MSLEEADFSGVEHNRNRRSIQGDDEITSEPWPISSRFAEVWALESFQTELDNMAPGLMMVFTTSTSIP